jgi:hypothetical protein
MWIIINAAWDIVLGILGAASLIIAKKPDAKALIDKLTPWQGWIGAVSALWGIWGIVNFILGLGILATAPIPWIMYLAEAVVCLVLGFLLGIGVVKTFVKEPKAVEKMDMVVKKLAPYQGILGIIAIILGIVSIPIYFIF